MKLTNIGMIATETSRSLAYLQSLLENNLITSHVLLLLDDNDELRPGQLSNNKLVSKFLIANGLNHDVLKTGSINHQSVINYLRTPELPEVFIYSGYGGEILGKEILSLDKKFLHVHGGYLPQFKGSTTFYYSILQENFIGYSAIFLSEKIDSGQILLRKKFPVPATSVDFDHTEDPKMRANILIELLLEYNKNMLWNETEIENIKTPYYYIIHPVLKNLAILSCSDSQVEK